jgi:hypothetical protein
MYPNQCGWQQALLAAVALLLVFAEAANAETVLARRRLGNNTEALTYDPLNDRAVALDGTDVIGIALNPLDAVVLATMREPDDGISGRGFRKLFDVLALDPIVRDFKGIVFVPTQGRYYFASTGPENATKFFSADVAGHSMKTFNLRGLDTSDWVQWEGMSWIPASAPAHGGTIAALGIRGDFLAHVFFVRLDGTVEAEVIPQPGTPLQDYLCGIQYWPQHPGTLLLSNCGVGTGVPGGHSQVYAMDMRTGALIGDPSKPLITMAAPGDTEGIVVRRTGQVFLSDYETGRLSAFDSSLNPTPGEDRLFVVGLGVSITGLTWNFDTGEFNAISSLGTEVFAVSRDLRSARLVFDVDVNHEVDSVGGGITYLGTGQIALANRFAPRGVDIADATTGFSLSRLIFLPPDYPSGAAFRPLGMGALGPDQLLVTVLGDNTALKVVSRTGTPNTDFFPDGALPTRFADLPLSVPTQGSGAQVFNGGAGPRIFTGNEIYDISGNLLHVIDADQLGLVEPPARRGTWLSGKTFANVDGLTSTVIVYTVP